MVISVKTVFSEFRVMNYAWFYSKDKIKEFQIENILLHNKLPCGTSFFEFGNILVWKRVLRI